MNNKNLICHYTSFANLISIIEKREIWATNVMYLNDSKEYRHACEIAAATLQEFQGEINAKSEAGQQFIDSMRRLLSRVTTVGAQDSFVASFSSNLDQLSQWRAYGNVGIIFYRKALSELNKNDGGLLILRNCTYSQSHFKRKIHEKLKHLYSSYMQEISKQKPDVKGRFFTELLFFLYKEALFIKDKGFREEKEVRISCLANRSEVEFRASGSCLVPYVKIPFDITAIKSVIVGPNVDPDRAEYSLQQFLASKIPENTPTVVRSIIPFRSW